MKVFLLPVCKTSKFSNFFVRRHDSFTSISTIDEQTLGSDIVFSSLTGRLGGL